MGLSADKPKLDGPKDKRAGWKPALQNKGNGG